VSGAFKLTITPVFNHETKEFGCVMADASREISRKIACAEEESTKRALKALGWMPPEEAAAMREKIEHLGKANSMLHLDLVDAHAETAKKTKRAEKAEAENAAMREAMTHLGEANADRLRLREALGDLLLIYEKDNTSYDSYGVEGSDWPVCNICQAEGKPGVFACGLPHDEGCAVHKFQQALTAPPPPVVAKADIEAMREAIREAFNSFAEAPESDAAWLLTERQTAALSKLQPFLKP